MFLKFLLRIFQPPTQVFFGSMMTSQRTLAKQAKNLLSIIVVFFILIQTSDMVSLESYIMKKFMNAQFSHAENLYLAKIS